jgi:hypothetical protein
MSNNSSSVASSKVFDSSSKSFSTLKLATGFGLAAPDSKICNTLSYLVNLDKLSSFANSTSPLSGLTRFR